MGFMYILVICNKRNNSEGKIKWVSGWVNNLPMADRMWYPEVGPLQEFTLQVHRYWSIFLQSQGSLPVTPRPQPTSVVHPWWSRCCNFPWEESSMGKNKVFQCFAPSHLSRHCQDASVLIQSFTVIAIDH